MGRGKAAAQVGHAAVSSYLECLRAHKDVAQEWLQSGQRKIVLKVDTEEALMKFFEAFKFKKIPCSLVSDAGLTQLPPGTKTALGVVEKRGNRHPDQGAQLLIAGPLTRLSQL